MKLFKSLMFLAAFLLAVYQSFSIGNPCDPCSVPWTIGTTTVIGTSGGCTFQVEYRYQICSDNEGALEITKIKVLPAGCTIEMNTLMQKAVKQIMEESPWILSIPAPGEGYTLHLVTKACWNETWTTSLPSYCQLMPCQEPNPCCSTKYVVHTAGGLGNLVICDQIVGGYYPSPINCSGIAQDGCYYMCEHHTVPTGYPLTLDSWPTTCSDEYCPTLFDADRTIVKDYPIPPQMCKINAFVSKRYCNDVLEIRIDGINLSGYGWSDNPPNPNNGAVFINSVKRILYTYGNEGITELTIRVPSCWKRSNGGEFRACNDVCCWETYALYKNANGEIFVTSKTPGGAGSTQCDEPCFNVCQYLDQIQLEQPLPSAKISYGDNDSQLSISSPESYVIPNPASGETEIKLFSNEKGVCLLEVYNTVGISVLSLKMNNDNGCASGKFNTSALHNGSYFYIIKIGGRTISNGSFIISN